MVRLRNVPRWAGFLACCLALHAVLLGCGSGEDDSSDSKTLKFLYWGSPDTTSGYIDGIEEFEKETGIKVEIEQVPYGDYQQKVGTYQAAGSGPDVMWMSSGGGINSFADILEPLNDLVSSSLIENTNGQSSACVDYDCSNDVLGVTQTLQAHPWYYNKAVLEKAGVLEPPATWSELAETCDKVIAAGDQCIATGQDFGGLLMMTAFWQQAATSDQCKGLADGSSRATEPPFVLAFELFEWLSEQGYFQDDVQTASLSKESLALFTTGKAAFFTGLLSDANNWATLYPEVGDDLGAMIVPSIEENFPIEGASPGPLAQSLDVTGGISFSIAKWSEKKSEAAEFIEFMSDPERQAYRADVNGAWPASRAIDPASIDNPAFQQLVPLVNASEGVCWPHVDPAGFGPVTADSQLILLGEKSAEEAAEGLDDTLSNLVSAP